MEIILSDANLELVDKIAQMPWYYLIIGSLIILPILIGSWILVLNQLGSGINQRGKKNFALVFLLIYTTGIIVSKNGNAKEAIIKEAISDIKSELKNKGWTMIGFQRVRNNLSRPDYTDIFLKKVISASNGLFHTTKLIDEGSHDTIGIIIDTVQQKQK